MGAITGAALLFTLGPVFGAEAASGHSAARTRVSFHLTAAAVEAGQPARGAGIVANVPRGAKVALQQLLSGKWGRVGVVRRAHSRYSAVSQPQAMGLVPLRAVVTLRGKTLAVSKATQARVYAWVPFGWYDSSSVTGMWTDRDEVVGTSLLPASITNNTVDGFGTAYGRSHALAFDSKGQCRGVRLTAGATVVGSDYDGTHHSATAGVDMAVLVPGHLPVQVSLEPGQTQPLSGSFGSASSWAFQATGRAQAPGYSADAVFGTPTASCYSRTWTD